MRTYDPEKRRARYLQYKDREIARQKIYYKKNRARCKQTGQEYYQANREKIIQRSIENRRKRRERQKTLCDKQAVSQKETHTSK